MNKRNTFRKYLAMALTICLLLPCAAFGDGNAGKKHFKEGMKYETRRQWDLAAQQFALAVAEDPGNAEYRLHLIRAMQDASLMFLKRGDALAEQQEFDSAYNAYKQAYAYDQTSEIARLKMERMIGRQRAQSGTGEESGYNPRTGNFVPAGADAATPQQGRSLDVLQTLEFKDTSLKLVIRTLARGLGLNVMFDESVKDNEKFSVSLQDVTQAKALDLILIQNKLSFELLDRRTILIYPDNQANHQRLARLLVKTFYLGNADLNETRTLVQSILIGGGQRSITPVKQINALVVRATAPELKLVQEVIESVDKPRAEVVINVEIYEVAHNTAQAIGNQLLAELTKGQPNIPSLSDLGGIGRVTTGALAGNAFSPLLGGMGTILGLPPTTLSLLQAKGKSRLLASTRIHALDGQQNQTKVGESVPVSIGTNYIAGFGGGRPGQPGAPTLPDIDLGNGTFDSIQYKDVGLVIDVIPTITTEGYVEIKMKLESTSVVSGTDINNRPRFTQRTLATVARMQDGKTAVVAGIKQETKSDTRASIPVLGMLPILGRFLTTPKQTSELRDIIITITPTIIRSTALKPEDHLARHSGVQQSGLAPSIEEIVLRAQFEDDRERRLQAKAQPAPLSTPLAAPAQAVEANAPMLNPQPKAESAVKMEHAVRKEKDN